MTRNKWVYCVLLLCVVGTYGESPVDELDHVITSKVEETQRAFAIVEKQLSAAQQMPELFSLEDTQMQLFAVETRAKLALIQEEVQQEMETAMLEVNRMRQKALENVTTWEKTLQGLQEATQKNEQTLLKIRKDKEKKEKEMQSELKLQKEQELKVKKELEMLQELERQRVMQKELEEKELKKLQELEQQELEKKRVLQQLLALQQRQQQLEKLREEEKPQKLDKQQDFPQKAHSSDGAHSDDVERTSAVKRVLSWYVSTEQTVLDTAASVYRLLVLPVVVILGFFLVLTVLIARYNAMEQARRNRRVLYSGYPKSYRPQAKLQQTPVVSEEPDLRPRVRRSHPRRDPNGFIEN